MTVAAAEVTADSNWTPQKMKTMAMAPRKKMARMIVKISTMIAVCVVS